MSDQQVETLLQNFRGCSHVYEKMRQISLRAPKSSILKETLVDGIKIITLQQQTTVHLQHSKTKTIERTCGSIDVKQTSSNQKVLFICLSCFRNYFSKIESVLKRQYKQKEEKQRQQRNQRYQRQKQQKRKRRQREEMIEALKSPQQKSSERRLLLQKENRRRKQQRDEKRRQKLCRVCNWISNNRERAICLLIFLLAIGGFVYFGIYIWQRHQEFQKQHQPQ